MKFENTRVYNFDGAFRGMRNPMNSWDKSDSYFGITDIFNTDALTDVIDAWISYENIGRRERGLEEYSDEMEDYSKYYDLFDSYESWLIGEGIQGQIYSDVFNYSIYDVAFLGPNDLFLAQSLIRAGDEHAKFMRQILVSVDITMPLYVWKELDTYKIGTTSNSTSTMHTLTKEPITLNSFELNDYESQLQLIDDVPLCVRIDNFINDLEQLRQMYLLTKDKRYWKELIRWLPESFLQTRTITMNYANLRNIYFQRRNHKLKEWQHLCHVWIPSLSYSNELIMLEDKTE